MIKFPRMRWGGPRPKSSAGLRIKVSTREKPTLSRTTGAKKSAVRLKMPTKERTASEKTTFAVASRTFHPSERPPGLKDWQAGRLRTHKKLTVELNTGFSKMLQQLSKPKDKRLRMAA